MFDSSQIPTLPGPPKTLLKYGTFRSVERFLPRAIGEPVQKIAAVPAQKWIDPAGNVIYLPVRSCRNQQDADDPGRYTTHIVAKKIRKGWLPWVYFSDDAAREREIAVRRAAHAKASEDFNRIWAARDEAEVMRSKEAMAKAVAEVTAAVMASFAEGRSKRTPAPMPTPPDR